jgi:hypothetical protein
MLQTDQPAASPAPVTYPVLIPISPGTREEWMSSEYPDYEDACAARASGEAEELGYPTNENAHVWEILDRRKTRIEIRGDDEAKEVLESGWYWQTDTGYENSPAWRAAVQRVCLRIAEATGFERTGTAVGEFWTKCASPTKHPTP